MKKKITAYATIAGNIKRESGFLYHFLNRERSIYKELFLFIEKQCVFPAIEAALAWSFAKQKKRYKNTVLFFQINARAFYFIDNGRRSLHGFDSPLAKRETSPTLSEFCRWTERACL